MIGRGDEPVIGRDRPPLLQIRPDESHAAAGLRRKKRHVDHLAAMDPDARQRRLPPQRRLHASKPFQHDRPPAPELSNPRAANATRQADRIRSCFWWRFATKSAKRAPVCLSMPNHIGGPCVHQITVLNSMLLTRLRILLLHPP